MKKYMLFFYAATLLFSGCAAEFTTEVPREEVVVRPEPPFAGAVWIDNEYAWRRGRYVLVPGYWTRPRGTWTRGSWMRSGRGYRWSRGRWH